MFNTSKQIVQITSRVVRQQQQSQQKLLSTTFGSAYNRYYSNNNSQENVSSSSSSSSSKSYLYLTAIATTSILLGSSLLFGDSVKAKEEDNEKSTTQTTREKIINNYQNRIREYSTPEKLFETFATVKKNGKSYMTVEDFIRSILPTRFKESNSKSMKPKSVLKLKDLPLSFKIADVDGDGLIDFSEYLFFSTLLSIPENSVPIAFKIMDVNHDNSIDASEFTKILKVLQNQSPFANSSTTRKDISSKGWVEHLFGKDGRKKMTLEDFQKLLQQVRRDVLQLEFSYYDPENTGFISQRDFGHLIVSYSKLGKLSKYLKSVESLPDEITTSHKGISFDQFVVFNTLLNKMDDIELSINLYKNINQPFTKKEFKYISKVICGVDPQPEVIDTVYSIFDTDKNGDLERDEFVSLMQRRRYRGPMANSRETTFIDKLKKVYRLISGEEKF
eukprot:gene6063-7553_t